MAEKKEHLEGLLEIIKTLITQEDNNWFKEALLKNLLDSTKSLTHENFENDPMLNKIYEHCIEEIIKRQGKDFYKDFIIEEIKEQLIADWQLMEHHRRRDDLDNFTLCLHQQIENITKHLFRKLNTFNKIKYDAEKIAYSKSDGTKYNDGNLSKVKVKQLIINLFEYQGGNFKYKPDNDYTLWFVQKDPANPKCHAIDYRIQLRAIIYYVYFKERVNTPDIFNKIFDLADTVYQVRNRNHRGEEVKGQKTKELYSKIDANKSQYTFIFYGFLAEFINSINQNLKKENNNPNPRAKPIQNNPLGEDPKLLALKQKLDGNTNK